jgi:hypothetical protein
MCTSPCIPHQPPPHGACCRGGSDDAEHSALVGADARVSAPHMILAARSVLGTFGAAIPCEKSGENSMCLKPTVDTSALATRLTPRFACLLALATRGCAWAGCAGVDQTEATAELASTLKREPGGGASSATETPVHAAVLEARGRGGTGNAWTAAASAGTGVAWVDV